MREIKFRIWDSVAKKMIYDGMTTHLGEEIYIRIHPNGEVFGQVSDDGGKNGLWEHEADLVKGRFTLLQFTGFHDKNGREIYEGDIVRWTSTFTGATHGPRIDSVEWRVSGWYLCPWIHEPERADMEVIGNIYENPALLERSK